MQQHHLAGPLSYYLCSVRTSDVPSKSPVFTALLQWQTFIFRIFFFFPKDHFISMSVTHSTKSGLIPSSCVYTLQSLDCQTTGNDSWNMIGIRLIQQNLSDSFLRGHGVNKICTKTARIFEKDNFA